MVERPLLACRLAASRLSKAVIDEDDRLDFLA